MAKCDDVEVKCLFQNVVTTMASVLELDETIQTVVVVQENNKELKPDTGARRMYEYIHQG